SPAPTPPLSLHDALPIFPGRPHLALCCPRTNGRERVGRLALICRGHQRTSFSSSLSAASAARRVRCAGSRVPNAWRAPTGPGARSEEHTSELQSLAYLVC